MRFVYCFVVICWFLVGVVDVDVIGYVFYSVSFDKVGYKRLI